MIKDPFPQPSNAARAKTMAKCVRERFSIFALNPEIIITKNSIFQAMKSSLVAWVRPPSEEEMSACLVTLVKDGVFQKVRDPSTPPSQWSEPVYQIVVPQKPLKPSKAVPKGQSLYFYSYGTHKCQRCGTIIQGKGRHRKSSRGHGKAECDSAMVAAMMEG